MTNVSCYGNHVKMPTLTIHDNYGFKVLVLHIVLIILQTLDIKLCKLWHHVTTVCVKTFLWCHSLPLQFPFNAAWSVIILTKVWPFAIQIKCTSGTVWVTSWITILANPYNNRINLNLMNLILSKSWWNWDVIKGVLCSWKPSSDMKWAKPAINHSLQCKKWQHF